MSRKSSDFVRSQAAKSGIGFVQLWVADVAGRLRGVTVTAGQLEHVFEDGAAMPASALGITSPQRDAQVLLVPDASSWAVLPRLDGAGAVVARMFCDVIEPDGTPSPWDSRGVLKRALGQATDLGYTFYAGATLQHYYLDGGAGAPRPLDHGPDHGFGPAPARQELVHLTVRALQQLGAVVNQVAQAAGPAQETIELAWADALTMADAIVTHRRVTCDIARGRGHGATFMPFPFAGQPGSALHVTLSLNDGGEPAFWDPVHATGGSATAHQFAAGVEAASADLSLVARPTVNSYTAALPEEPLVYLAPVGARGEVGGVLHYRGADASANPYLLFAALLEAGLGAVRVGDTPRSDGVVLPLTLVQAAALAGRSPLLRQVLGADLLAALVARAHADGAAYRNQVTAWELERYLDVY
ncbi:MAG: glutamine synthetase [Deltaproteobacteria bacterium]|nr:MAG: glutamine synthetase [Deltaproteobacteria bacterium]